MLIRIHRNYKGFTIVEALVALVILAILLLGLLSALITAYEISTRNLIRDEAVKIANEYAEKYRNFGLSNIPTNDTFEINRKIRNADITYNINVTSSEIVAGKIKQVKITVTWTYKGKTYSHTIETLVGSS